MCSIAMDGTTHHVAVSPESQAALSDLANSRPMVHDEKDRIRPPNRNINRSRFNFNPPIEYVEFSESQKALPIYVQKEQILSSVENNRITLITAETGSGKSTQVPQYIMNHSAQLNRHCRIVCALPRRLAVQTVAKHVAAQRNSLLGKTVGYQVRLDNCTTPNTSLIYMTR